MVILLCQKSKYIFGKCFLQLFEITASKNRSYDIQGQQFINYSLHRLWSPCPTVGHCNSAFHHPSDLRQVTPTKISGKLPATHSSANVYLVHSTKLVLLKAKYYFFFFKKKKKKTFCGLQCYWSLDSASHGTVCRPRHFGSQIACENYGECWLPTMCATMYMYITTGTLTQKIAQPRLLWWWSQVNLVSIAG